MYSLRLFGGLSLSTARGPVAGRAAQRRRLALLAVLAVARGRPVSRDRLIALLWSEADTEQARHLLADSIYVLRTALGDGVLASVGDDVTLDLTLVSSDVVAFWQALEDGDHARAVAVYAGGGPFLDGVHVSDAPEFERWAEAVRVQVTADYRRALESLATGATDRHRHAEGISWWRQLAASDRLSSRVALRLMHALVDAGDIAGALDFAGVHERIVGSELETTPDPAVLQFAHELRGRRAVSPVHPHSVLPSAGKVLSPSEELTGSSGVLPSPARIEPDRQQAARAPTSRMEAPSPAMSSSARFRWRRLTGVLLLPLVAATFYLLRHRPLDATSSFPIRTVEATVPSLVLLPLVNIGGDSAGQRFADGLTEEIIATLSRSDRLRVISSTSAFAFRGRPTDVRLIADSLHVSHVLEGALQRTDTRIRLTLRLIDAATGMTQWSKTYDQVPEDLFAVEDSIGRAVARELHVRLSSDSGAPLIRHQTRNLVAYEWYLLGRDPAAYRSDSNQRAAIGYLEHAVAEDPRFAAAYAELAFLYAVGGSWGRPSVPAREQRELFAKAEALARKALELDDSLSFAHTTLAVISMHKYDLRTAAEELRKALALDPRDSYAHEFLAAFYWWTERPAAALAESRRSVTVDPLSAEANLELGHALFFAREYAEALVQLQRVAVVSPPFRRTALYRAEIDMMMGNWDSAITALSPLSAAQHRARGLLGYALGRAGDSTAARRVLAELVEGWSTGRSGAYEAAVVNAGLGDFDQAFRWLDRAFEHRSLEFEVMGPLFDGLRSDRRFGRVRQRLGIPPSHATSSSPGRPPALGFAPAH